MTINRILYIDDSFENGMTAMNTDSRIDFVSSPKLIERPLRDYDCIITDMQMEHDESGFEVVERGIREGILPYVATGGTYEHGGTFDRVRVFDSDLIKTFDKISKSEKKFWREALQFIDARDGTATQQALIKVREILGVVPEESVRRLMDFYRRNYENSMKGGNEK